VFAEADGAGIPIGLLNTVAFSRTYLTRNFSLHGSRTLRMDARSG